MSKKIIIFGVGNIAEVAHYYLMNDSNHEIIAFSCEKRYITNKSKFGLPVVSFEDIEKKYPPYEFSMFAPCSGNHLNRYRERIYNEGKKKGYNFISYISSNANVFTKDIGENCFILEDNTIQPYTKIGNNCVLWSGNHIGHHSVIEDHVFLSSHVVICGECLIKKYCWLGVNSSIRNNLILAEGTVVGMDASVVKNTEDNAIYLGIPAKLYKKCDESIVL